MSKRKPRRASANRDPYHAREAKKYANPIPSREFILNLMEEHGAPLRFDDLAEAMALKAPDQQEALSRRLAAMSRDGQVVCNRRGGYCVVNHEDLIHGRVIGHPDGFGFLKAEVIGHPDGFGFLKADEGGDDLFLSPREMRRVWHGDRVVARVAGLDRRGRREAAVVEVLERAFEKLVGRMQIEGGVAFLLPDNKRVTQQVLITPEKLAGATDGQMVVVRITDHPDHIRQPLGEVVEILGDHLAAGMATDVAIRAHDIPSEWPEAVEREISSLSSEVPEAAKQGRQDLRDTPLVTIDGADARDFDDAVFCERTRKGWRLLVAIADVSSYVKSGTALDEEAYKRGTSVYFPDRVVPMLPEVLSNGLCSLNPRVDRLCMTAELYFDASGQLYRSRFFEAVMNSHARLTYDQVGAMLFDGDPALCREHAKLLPHLNDLYGLFRLLHTARAERGAIDFDTVETRFRFDDDGKLSGIVPLVRHDAHKVIEECMLAANVAAARHLLRNKMPALYRIHEKPSAEKLSDLREFLAELGLRMDGGDSPTAKDYANLLEQVKERPDFHVIQVVLLRSMMQAVYSDNNVGHFGLAFPAYTHFTSPIRRYPDLMVHRALRHLLTGEPVEAFEYTHQHLQAMGEHCSATERRADDATRDAADTLKCEFLLDKVGETYDGVISGVNSFGIFVELNDIYISGLVHITALDYDYFHFDPIGHRLRGDRTGKVYRLGDSLKVRIAAVNIDDRKIDFVLAEKVEGPGKGGGRPGRSDRNDDKGKRTSRPGRRAAGKGSATAESGKAAPKRKGEKPAEDATKGTAKKADAPAKRRRRRRKPAAKGGA